MADPTPPEELRDERTPQNRLANETSAYLRQHMLNPVDWWPWGEEARALARERDVPLLVSIGYSACHWCHVMAHESFEDADTARVMNQLFVPVKVDREERPDVDQIYMDTVVRLTGRGGWPLTVFALPDGRPFHAGTYYPPEPRQGMPSFRDVMRAVDQAWRERRDEIEKAASQILRALDEPRTGVAEEPPSARTVAQCAAAIMQGADREHGGFGDGPKFPTPTNLEVVLASADLIADDTARDWLEFVRFSCIEMARRGLYDQLGGGFHRYCVDGRWTIPHFEKMLYDQGLLLRVYCEMFRRSLGDEELAWPIRETVQYLEREMTAPEGGFFASQDADSEGEEGKFFVWTPEQIEAELGAAAAGFCDTYSVTPRGNFEHGTTQLVDRAREPRAHCATERSALYAVRSQRIAPATDRKRVAAWNGYAISGLARAATWLDEPAYLEQAVRAADFVLENMRDADGRLLRVYNEGRAHISAFLDDTASLLDACLDLYRAGGGDRFVAAAAGFADDIATRFFDADRGELFLTPSDGERLAHRPRSDHDGATPEAIGLATVGLVRLGALAERADWQALAERVIGDHAFALQRSPHAHPTLVRAVALSARGLSVAVVIGERDTPATRALAQRARTRLLPEDSVIVAAPGEAAPTGVAQSWLDERGLHQGEPAAYICHGTTCSLPATDPDALEDLQSLFSPG
ncbi:MAG: thioredoxin domain-containing protein [Myxococcota bacterium]|nr:thioredoxin domain-containing protein [Myxococcota bacterium]